MADSDKEKIILGLIASAEPARPDRMNKQEGVSKLEFRTTELRKEHPELYDGANPSAKETAQLFSKAIERLGSNYQDINVSEMRDMRGTVIISGTPEKINSLIKAADTELKKQSMKAALEQFNDPTYQAKGTAEQTMAQALPNVRTASTDITRA